MKKSVIAIILCTVLILTTFAACGKKYLTITDEDGITHFLLTDDNGNTVVNADGNIAVVNTDKNGEIVTEKGGEIYTEGLTFPSVVISKDNIYENVDFQWKFSDEWTLSPLSIENKNKKYSITVSTVEGSFSDAIKAAQDEINSFSEEFYNLLKPTEQAFSIIGARQAEKFTYTHGYPDDPETKYVCAYYIEINNTVYFISTSQPYADKDSFNFDNMFTFFLVK